MKDITLVTLFAGRWQVMNGFLTGFDGLDYPKKNIHVVWMTNSHDYVFHEMLEREAAKRKDKYKSFKVIIADEIKPSKNAFLDRGTGVVEHANVIARIYNTVFRYVKTELVMTLEDDVVAPSHAVKRLLKLMDIKDVAYASGLMFGRHGEGMFSWDILEVETPRPDSGQYQVDFVSTPIKMPWGVRDVGVTHLGCTMMKMSILNRCPKPLWRARTVLSNTLFGCDMCMCLQLKTMGYRVLVDFDVRTSHIDSVGDIH